MKSKFLTAAALACAISLAAPGIASAQGTSSVSASGTTTFCAINGVEVSCDSADRPAVDLPAFEVPSLDRPSFDRASFDRPDFDRPGFGSPSGDRPSFETPRFGPTDFGRPSFTAPALPTSESSSSVTVTSSARAVSNGTSTTTSTLCTMNGVEVACGAGTSAIARPAFDFSTFDFSIFGR